ncbi:ESX secretion-associated protein EspG [Amycolatopsis minnesotensis]|uniref:ESX secretion-associated protein EspG n=1 Tax=Amycolatopsis minnesotensis TaxID=337894 RepID=A0ABP5ED84_9PSEU
MIDHPVVLPKMMFVTAWEMTTTGGDLPAVIGTNTHYWMAEDSRRTLVVDTMEALREQGLARGDRLHPGWKNTLAVIGRSDREFYAWNHFSDGTATSILVAARDRDAVRVVVGEDAVMIDPVEPKFLATHLLEALPDVPGAAVRTVAIPEGLLEDSDAAPADPLAEPIDTRDVEYLSGLMRAPRDAIHQLYTATRTVDGERERSLPISALDLTGQGRILTYMTGDDYIAVTTGSPHRLIRTLNNTHQQLV